MMFSYIFTASFCSHYKTKKGTPAMSRECPFGAVWRMFCCKSVSGPRYDPRDLPAGKVKFRAQLVVCPAVDHAPAQDLPVALVVDRLGDSAVDFTVCVLHRVLLCLLRRVVFFVGVVIRRAWPASAVRIRRPRRDRFRAGSNTRRLWLSCRSRRPPRFCGDILYLRAAAASSGQSRRASPL